MAHFSFLYVCVSVCTCGLPVRLHNSASTKSHLFSKLHGTLSAHLRIVLWFSRIQQISKSLSNWHRLVAVFTYPVVVVVLLLPFERSNPTHRRVIKCNTCKGQ